jgi:HPt (histidine-containing phosphotransfer) domain-containing protein
LKDIHAEAAVFARERDFSELARTCHVLLGHAKMIGATSLASAASHLELAAAARNAASFGDRLHRVEREIRLIMEELRHDRPAGQPA